MAIDNLNYYSSWLPAWQQTDKYTSQPWCLKSKNLDIFSSSKSVKATAWSEPSAVAGDIIKQDGKLILKTDWKVYDISSWTETFVVDPSANFPVHKVSYTWKEGTYADAQWGTPQDLMAKYEWDTLKSFTVFTDRAAYTYSDIKFIPNKSITTSGDLVYQDVTTSWYEYKRPWTYNVSTDPSYIYINIENAPFASMPLEIHVQESGYNESQIALDQVLVKWYRYYYDGETDSMIPTGDISADYELPFSWNISDGITLDIPMSPANSATVRLKLTYTPKPWETSHNRKNWSIFVNMNWWSESTHKLPISVWVYSDWDYNSYYSYLPIRDRKFQDVWEYFWTKWSGFQILNTWEWTWVSVQGENKTRYDFVQYMWWANDPNMDVIWMISWNESIYMIGNMNWNWYIFPCDLTWTRWTPFIAYGCTFKWATNIDYLLYLVWEDRGISQLWVYNGQELVPLLWWNLESWVVDYINSDEQYNFDWKMVEYRGNLVLATTDGRIFEYWQTYWGKWGAFIHDLKPRDHDSLTITWLKTKGNDLLVQYTTVDTVEWIQVTTDWAITYCDDVVVGRIYNNEWEAVYPIVLGNHLLEKEESDLYASYILPDWDTHLEFWGCANHYHFWTFKTSQYLLVEDPTWNHRFGIKGTQGDYYLEFVERVQSPDWLDWYTFRLVWSLPLMAAGTTNTVVYLDDDWEMMGRL